MMIFVIGHLLKSDCAIGLRVGELLKEAGVQVHELSGDLFTMVDEFNRLRPKRAVVVGAAERGKPPGTITEYLFKPYKFKDEFDTLEAMRPSLEGRISLEDFLVGLSVLGTTAEEIYVIECEPYSTAPGVGLTPGGEQCAREIVRRVLERYVQG